MLVQEGYVGPEVGQSRPDGGQDSPSPDSWSGTYPAATPSAESALEGLPSPGPGAAKPATAGAAGRSPLVATPLRGAPWAPACGRPGPLPARPRRRTWLTTRRACRI